MPSGSLPARRVHAIGWRYPATGDSDGRRPLGIPALGFAGTAEESEDARSAAGMAMGTYDEAPMDMIR